MPGVAAHMLNHVATDVMPDNEPATKVMASLLSNESVSQERPVKVPDGSHTSHTSIAGCHSQANMVHAPTHRRAHPATRTRCQLTQPRVSSDLECPSNAATPQPPRLQHQHSMTIDEQVVGECQAIQAVHRESDIAIVGPLHVCSRGGGRGLEDVSWDGA